MSQENENKFKKRGNPSRGYRNKKPNVSMGDVNKKLLENVVEDHPIISAFKKYAVELDEKHDKYERLVKISRDITIESKRIIFLLHTIDKDSKRSAILSEAETRLNNLVKVLFKKIAEELDGEDAYQYVRAYRPGLQEFIEAFTFYGYLQSNCLYDWNKFSQALKYLVDSSEQQCPMETDQNQEIEIKGTHISDEMSMDPPSNIDSNQDKKMIETVVPPVEYVLGIADLTGELMRKCISNLSTGDIQSCYQTCDFVRCMYQGFIKVLGISGREVSRKVYTLRQSLAKMENVCYTIKVRGSEIPEHMLAEAVMAAAEHITVEEMKDEGYQDY